MENNVLKVIFDGEEVGRLYWDKQGNRAVFSYTASFVKKGIDIAPLVAPIKNWSPNAFPILGNKDKTYQGLPSFIADSLPDRWGNKVFEQWAAQNHIPLRQLTPVDKLAFIGKRGMGALEFEPATSELESSEKLEIDSLYKLAKEIFNEREQIAILPDEQLTLQSLYEVGTSAGGQYPKAIIAINENTGDIRSGQVLLPPDYTYYILKFAESGDFPFTNIEITYYEVAKLAGINIMPSKLIEIDGKQHFLTQRFDRKNGKKIHIQTLAAMMPDATSYEELFAVCRELSIPQTEIEEQYKRLIFNQFGGNIDDHSKNFSFMMEADNQWHITPAYDLTFTTNLDGANYENRHSLTLLGKDNGITEKDLLLFAQENNIREADKIIAEVAEAFTHLYELALNNGVDAYWADRIEAFVAQLVPSTFAERMKHYLPTIIEPYKTDNNLTVCNFKLTETPHHDFHFTAEINGQKYRYTARRNSELAKEIILNGRGKMSVECIKRLIAAYLLPLVKG